MNADDNDNRYAEMGIAALLPGMQYIIQLMQEQLDDMRTRLAALQGNGLTPPRRGAGRPKEERPKEARTNRRSGWPADPKARRREMLRRKEVAQANKTKSRLSEARKAEWAAMSPAKKKRRLAALAAGKKAAA